MRTSTVCVFTLIQLMCQEVYSDMQCVHNPAKVKLLVSFVVHNLVTIP